MYIYLKVRRTQLTKLVTSEEVTTLPGHRHSPPKSAREGGAKKGPWAPRETLGGSPGGLPRAQPQDHPNVGIRPPRGLPRGSQMAPGDPGGLPGVQAPSMWGGGDQAHPRGSKGILKGAPGGDEGGKGSGTPWSPPSLRGQASRGAPKGLPGDLKGAPKGVPGGLPGASRGAHPHTPFDF